MEKKYWEDFLNNTKNIWQAAKYLADKIVNFLFSVISKIKNISNKKVSALDDIAHVLLSNFFFLHSSHLIFISNSSMSKISYTIQLSSTLFTLVEVRAAIFKVFPFKDQRNDGFLAVIWQKL